MKQILHSLAFGLLFLLGSTTSRAQFIIHIAGNNDAGHSGDSTLARFASLRCPTSVCIDDSGDLYIADGGPMGYMNDGCIRKVKATTGIITTITGKLDSPAIAANFLDSIPATAARLNGSSSVIIDRQGNLIIADGKSCVRRINLSTGIIKTIAGSLDSAGYFGDGDLATKALLNGPVDVAVDADNNVYIVDMNNHRIRRVNAITGIINTIAGSGSVGYSGDGGAAISAKFRFPRGICVDNNRNMYIADYDNNCVRKVTAAGVITTIAGNGPGFSGDGFAATAAKLAQPARVVLDKAEANLYIADVANQRIRKVTLSTGAGGGIISTYAGNGNYFTGPDTKGNGGLATKASIVPYGMCFDSCGNMFLGGVMQSVRAITPVLPTNGILCKQILKSENIAALNTSELTIYPNPNNGTFNVNVSSTANEPIQITITDITGRKIATQSSETNKDTQIQLNNPKGLYFINVATPSGVISNKILVQ
ncbi:MAG: T9SS type A sorting domain-containing protein [Taibaiella sp.]|nr:T9SS type A sorting domain-containing protein [Taibaiella sp.]